MEKNIYSSGLNFCVGFMGRTTAEEGPHGDTFSHKYHRRFSSYYMHWNCITNKCFRYKIHRSAKAPLVRLMSTPIIYNKKPEWQQDILQWSTLNFKPYKLSCTDQFLKLGESTLYTMTGTVRCLLFYIQNVSLRPKLVPKNTYSMRAVQT